MGWFDSDKAETGPKPGGEGGAAPEPRTGPEPKPSPAPARTSGGSTLGERVHINGTIVCEEALQVRGRVEGKIRAREDLTIAEGADVRATIQGRRIRIEGRVKGDVQAAEQLVLGRTARLDGNIASPSLEINEGAFFKGSVEMVTREAGSAAPDKGSPRGDRSPGPRRSAAGQPAVAPATGATPATAKSGSPGRSVTAGKSDAKKDGGDQSADADDSSKPAPVARADRSGK